MTLGSILDPYDLGSSLPAIWGLLGVVVSCGCLACAGTGGIFAGVGEASPGPCLPCDPAGHEDREASVPAGAEVLCGVSGWICQPSFSSAFDPGSPRTGAQYSPKGARLT